MALLHWRDKAPGGRLPGPVTLQSREDFLHPHHERFLAGAGWPCVGLSEPAEQRSGAGSGRLRPKSDVSEAPYPGPSCRTCPA